MLNRRFVALGLTCLSLLTAQGSCVAAQDVKKSQHALVRQQVAGTLITVEYNRPVARGRTLFGGIVPWGRTWTPGADTATSIVLSTSVKVNGNELAAGGYTIWAQPGPEKWTIIFSRAYPVFHVPYPAGKEVLRSEVVPRTGTHMETLAFYFPVVEERHAELVLHWGTVVVPISIDVP
jgi:hypothetical protein